MAGEVDPVARIVRATAVYGTPAELPSLASVKETCGTDALCAAREIVAASAGRVRLEAVAHPESDTIRWAETAPSVTAVHEGPDGRRWIVLDGFGRKAVREVAQAMSQAMYLKTSTVMASKMAPKPVCRTFPSPFSTEQATRGQPSQTEVVISSLPLASEREPSLS